MTDINQFPPDSPESVYLSRAIEKDIQVLSKQGPPSAVTPPRKRSAAAEKLAEELDLNFYIGERT